MSRARWMRQRRTGLGGSDIAAILGFSPWRSAVDVWADKMAATSDEQADSATEAMYWGRRLETAIAEHYAEEHGIRLYRTHGIVRHPQHPWAIGTPDRVIAAPGLRVRLRRGQLHGAESLLEIKTAAAYELKHWIDGDMITVPTHYVAQCMWYLAVTGLATCHVAALIGGQRYIETRIQRDDETIAEMLRRAGQWWQRHIVEGVPPDPETARDLQILAPRDSGRVIEASTQMADLVMRAAQARALRLAAEKQYDALAEQIQMAMGDASEIRLDGQRLVTWRAGADRKVVDWEAVARDVAGGQVPAEILLRHTTVRTGARRFLLHVQAQLPAGSEPPQIAGDQNGR